MRRHHTDGPIAWTEAGSGDPVVFLHPIVATRSFWDPQLDDLADTWRCLAWDAPGYGSSAPAPSAGFVDVADALHAILDTVGLARVDLVGLSLGAMHAMHFARRHPTRVRRLVLADTSPAFGVDPDVWLADWLAPLDRGDTPATIARGVIESVIAQPLPGATMTALIESMSRISAEAFRAASHTLVSHDLRDRLDEIPHETLVIVGADDAETPLEYAEQLVAGLPAARLRIIDGAGHLSSREAPEAFNDAVRGFLRR